MWLQALCDLSPVQPPSPDSTRRSGQKDPCSCRQDPDQRGLIGYLHETQFVRQRPQKPTQPAHRIKRAPTEFLSVPANESGPFSVSGSVFFTKIKNIFSVKQHSALCRRKQPVHHSNQGAFSRPRLPHNHQELALMKG